MEIVKIAEMIAKLLQKKQSKMPKNLEIIAKMSQKYQNFGNNGKIITQKSLNAEIIPK